jgi:CheY-like chemotaxis protein
LSSGRQKPRILVIDDDLDALTALSEILESAGFDAVCANDGQQAWELIREAPAPHLVVLDLLMPRMDGWTFRMHQRRDPNLASIPVVVVSSLGETLVDDHLEAVFSKPLDIPTFLQAVKVGVERTEKSISSDNRSQP